jgi:solute carrier organic anion transporter family, member 4A
LFFYTFSGLVVNGFVNVVITTIERRYGLRSSQTGLIASGYDIASFLFLVPVTYFGGRRGASKPRWIGWGVVIMGLGSFVFALPHFLVGQYRASGGVGNGTLQVIFFKSEKILNFLPSICSRTKKI